MIKKIFVMTVMLLLIPSLVTADQFTIDIETAYTDPYPVEPGQNFVLSLQVTNKGNEKVGKVDVDLDPHYPFTVLENARKSVNDLDSWGKKIIEYDLFVDSSVISTLYEIPVNVIYGSLSTATQNVQVRVQGTPQFEILDVKTNEINPGDRETLNVQIQNVGTGTAKRLRTTFTSSSDDIVPIFSGGSVYINEFKGGEKQWIKFDILVDQDAEYGVYAGTITSNYNDESGTAHTNTYDIGILVSGQPRFDVLKSEIDVKDKELEVEVINSGTAKGIAIKSELWINSKLFDTDYVTQVKMDKKTNLKFNLPKKATSGVVKLHYRGPDNKEYTQKENIAWQPVNETNGLLILIGLGLVGYLVWRKPWRKTKWYKKRKK